jgi:hypothetical protein
MSEWQPSRDCVFCDIEVEHTYQLCGLVRRLEAIDRERFLAALDHDPPAETTETA